MEDNVWQGMLNTVLPEENVSPRVVVVPAGGARMRLDRFLTTRFRSVSRTAMKKGIVAGLVTDPTGRPLRASSQVHDGQQLWIRIPGIAPDGPPPPLPPIVYEDDRLVVLNKPSGLVCHPRGTVFRWSVTALTKQYWPDSHIDLCHRLDQETSGLLVLSKDVDANRFVKLAISEGRWVKEYDALCRGIVNVDHQHIIAPIGPGLGPIRIQMAVRPDGLFAHTEVTVVARKSDVLDLTWVRCRLHTGRSHQIRLHLNHVGHPVLGDRMYGTAPEVFVDAWLHGVTEKTLHSAGAPHQALHAAYVRLPHPNGTVLEVSVSPPETFCRWWKTPEVLPLDGWGGVEPDGPNGQDGQDWEAE